MYSAHPENKCENGNKFHFKYFGHIYQVLCSFLSNVQSPYTYDFYFGTCGDINVSAIRFSRDSASVAENSYNGLVSHFDYNFRIRVIIGKITCHVYSGQYVYD